MVFLFSAAVALVRFQTARRCPQEAVLIGKARRPWGRDFQMVAFS